MLLAEAIWGSLTSQHGLKVWLDVKMADKSEAAMEHGVRNSKMVIAIVNRAALNPDRPDDYPAHNTLFQRAYCVQELRWAKEAGKIIQPTIRFEDKQNIGDMMSLAPDDLQFMGETEFIELERNDGAYWNVGIRKLLERLGVTGGLSAQPIVSNLSLLDFTADLQAHGENFVEGTRQWVFDDIEAWRKDRDGSRCLVLLAGPGFGKTAIVARYITGFHDRQHVLALHLCFHNDTDKRDPIRMVKSLAFQITERVPEYKRVLTEEVLAGDALHALQKSIDEQKANEVVDKPPPRTDGEKASIMQACLDRHASTVSEMVNDQLSLDDNNG